MNVDESMKYTMGVYLCLDGSINGRDPSLAVPFDTLKTFDEIHRQNINFIYFTSGEHKIKKKAEQIACEKAIKLIEYFTN